MCDRSILSGLDPDYWYVWKNDFVTTRSLYDQWGQSAINEMHYHVHACELGEGVVRVAGHIVWAKRRDGQNCQNFQLVFTRRGETHWSWESALGDPQVHAREPDGRRETNEDVGRALRAGLRDLADAMSELLRAG